MNTRRFVDEYCVSCGACTGSTAVNSGKCVILHSTLLAEFIHAAGSAPRLHQINFPSYLKPNLLA